MKLTPINLTKDQVAALAKVLKSMPELVQKALSVEEIGDLDVPEPPVATLKDAMEGRDKNKNIVNCDVCRSYLRKYIAMTTTKEGIFGCVKGLCPIAKDEYVLFVRKLAAILFSN